MRLPLVLFLSLILAFSAQAQQKITGSIVDKTNNNPLRNVTIQLLNRKDSRADASQDQ